MTNSMGFRSPEFSREKKSGVVRILFLGSSTTFGVTGPIEKTFPFLVGEILRQEMPDVKIEILNAAQPNKTSYWELQRMEETLSLEPDIWVVMTGYNDTASIHNHFVEISQSGELIIRQWHVQLHQWIAEHSVFYVTLREKIALLLYGSPSFAFSRPGDSTIKKSPEDIQAWFRNYPLHFRKNLEKMANLARPSGAQLVFLKGPLSASRKERHPIYSRGYLRLMEELRKVSVKYQISMIDLDSTFSGKDSAGLFMEDGLHFTDSGNLEIAKAVSEFFVRNRKDYLEGKTSLS